MKKIVIILLIFLLIPVFSIASDESDFLGTWVQCTESENGIIETTLHFRDNHLVYFTAVILNDDDEGGENAFVRNYVGEWHLTRTGVHAQTGFNSSMECFIVEPGVMGEKLTGAYSPYYRVMDKSGNKSQSNTDQGTTVEQGTYTVGIDIPAGVYRIESIDEKSADIYIYKDKDASFYTDFVLISKTTPSCARLELTDGQVVRIQMGPVLFTKPTGMNFDWINNNE